MAACAGEIVACLSRSPRGRNSASVYPHRAAQEDETAKEEHPRKLKMQGELAQFTGMMESLGPVKAATFF